MGTWARCPWGGIILILAWGIGSDGGPASRWCLARPLAGLQSRSAPGTSYGEGPKSREEAAMGAISSLRNHSLVFLEHPVGCSVSPASLRGRDHVRVNTAGGRAGGSGCQLGRTQHMSHCPELPGASTPGAPLKEVAGQDVKHAHTQACAHSRVSAML